MRVITPTPTQLITSNLADPAPLWASGTSFVAGADTRDLNSNGIEKIYRAIVDNSDKKPKDHPEIWQEIKTSNVYALLDAYVDTVTTKQDSITLTVQTSKASHLCFFGLVGERVRIVTRADGEEIADETIELMISGQTTSFMDYCFSGFEFRSILIHPIPGLYLDVELDITIEATPGTDAACGFCSPGFASNLYLTQWGPTTGIDDYSVKKDKGFGETEYEQGPFSKPLSVDVMIKTSPDGREADRVYRQLAALRSIPAIYDANNDGTNRETLITLGVYERLSIVAKYTNETQLLLEIEGII